MWRQLKLYRCRPERPFSKMTAVNILSAIISLKTTPIYTFGVSNYIYKAKKSIFAIADIALATIL